MKTCRNYRRSRARASRRRPPSGFTLLEVLATLMIVGVALVYLVAVETASLKEAAGTRVLREATMLASKKMAEITSGVENTSSGTFEGTDIKWSAVATPLGGGVAVRKVTLTVTYTSVGKTCSFNLEQVVE